MNAPETSSTVGVHELRDRRRRLAPGVWHSVRQVHGRGVVEVNDRSSAECRPEADALVTRTSGRVLVVHAGDCVPVGLVHRGGAVAAVHAGWKGLEAGVIGAAAAAIRATAGADDEVLAVIGPHIRVDRYEFGDEDLTRLVARFGADVGGRTDEGRPALDLTAATRAALAEADVTIAHVSTDCTAAAADRYWSHRARGEAGRIGLVAWLEST